jgi:hypothetical protein
VAEGQNVAGIDFGNTSLATKFYVVNDVSVDRTYEYNAGGGLIEAYSLNSGNTAPRGAASTIAGDKTWVVDANRNVYVYNTSGGLLGSWTAGTLASNATVEGIATNGTDICIVDAKSDKVFKYSGAATRRSGSQNAASSFNLNGSNTSPKDIVTDGTHLWVVNDTFFTDKVFKYKVSGSLVGSWTISSGGGSPTGITIDPSNGSQDIWIVDSGTDKVYQYTNGRSRTSGSQAAAATFALAPGNTNPQGIADPPLVVAQQSDQPALTRSPTPIAPATDAVLQGMARMPEIDDALFRTGARRVEANSGLPATGRFVGVDSTLQNATMNPSAAAAPVDRSHLARPAGTHRQQVHDELFATWNSERADLVELGLADGT